MLRFGLPEDRFVFWKTESGRPVPSSRRPIGLPEEEQNLLEDRSSGRRNHLPEDGNGSHTCGDVPLDGPSDGVFTTVTSQLAASSLELRALPLGSRKLADEQARELGYLGYSGLFDGRTRSSSGRASECSRISLQKALFEPYTVKSMQAW